MGETAVYLNLDGIPSTKPRGDGKVFFWRYPQGSWRLSAGDHSHEVDDVCVQIHEAFRMAIMQGVPYGDLVCQVPQFVVIAGLNSEAPIPCGMFEVLLRKFADFREINRFLYLYDCERLVSSIQECSKEVIQILGEFYLSFNTDPFFHLPVREDRDEVRFSSSPVTTKLFAFLNFLFIRMHSLLDYAVKVAIEAKHLRTDFSKYPRMASLRMQFGDRKQLSFNGQVGTLFEDCQFVTAVETLRNHVIHDAMLDEMPKAYERFEGGVAVERFILFPDMTEGRLDRYVNRNLFFGSEDKINLRLPELVSEFQVRLSKTLEEVLTILRRRHQAP